MGYDDDLWLEHCDHRRRIYQFAQYAAHLCTGSTIQVRAIRHSTVLRYLNDAATFVKLKTGIDPRHSLGTSKMDDAIQKVLDEYKRWEKIPQRREPWTVEMQQAFDAANRNLSAADADSLPVALADWFALGLSTGFRVGEWAQPNKHHADPSNPDDKEWDGITAAMLPRDFTFYDRTGRKIPTLEAAVALGIQHVGRVRLTWRVQKNLEHGESKTYVSNDATPELCPVNRALRIAARHLRIVDHNRENVPLGAYRDPVLGTRLIIADDIETHMRSVAAKVLNLDPVKDKDDLARWSSHSLRVGACQVLYALGFHAFEIQMLLRWKSDSFMKYLRDIAWVARKQADAMTTIASNTVQPFL